MAVAGWWLFDKLPDIVPVHWNYAGQPDGYGNKNMTVWLFPGLTFGCMLLFWYLPKIDPMKEKYQTFADVWELFQTVIIGFFAYMYFISLYGALHVDFNVSKWVIGGIGSMFVLMGNYMGKIRQNYFVGIKTPWTLSNEQVWNKTHRFGGWCFVIAGLLLLVSAVLGYFSLAIFIVSIVLAAIVPIIYSYWIFKQL